MATTDLRCYHRDLSNYDFNFKRQDDDIDDYYKQAKWAKQAMKR